MSDGIAIADRYTTSNAIHQCSKLLMGEWERFLDWLVHYGTICWGYHRRTR